MVVKKKFLLLPGIKLKVIQATANRYTDSKA
jgi:hypothetical protein